MGRPLEKLNGTGHKRLPRASRVPHRKKTLPTNDKPEKSAKYKMHMALGLMFLTVFIDLIGFGIIIPVLPLYAKQFGANGLTIGLLLTSYSLMQFFFAPMWGRLSDRIG